MAEWFRTIGITSPPRQQSVFLEHTSHFDTSMNSYLVGFTYHYPENLKLWYAGITEDFEASTGVFIEAQTEREALAWAATVARALHAQENPEDPDSWDEHSHHCWIEEDPNRSAWKHCLSFFQRVKAGEMPRLSDMNAEAYVKWGRETQYGNRPVQSDDQHSDR